MRTNQIWPEDEMRKYEVIFERTLKERGRNNFHNYASQFQVGFVRSQIIKISK